MLMKNVQVEKFYPYTLSQNYHFDKNVTRLSATFKRARLEMTSVFAGNRRIYLDFVSYITLQVHSVLWTSDCNHLLTQSKEHLRS